MPEERLNQARLVAENRQLRKTSIDLAKVVEELAAELAAEREARVGRPADSGPPAILKRAHEQRKQCPDVIDEGHEGIHPPWKREGYEGKQAWLEDDRE